MNKTVRNVLIAVGVAALVGLVFGFLGAATQTPEVASSGQVLAIAAGCLAFFIAHLRGGNRRVAAGQEGHRVLGVGDLVEAAHLTALAFAFTAAAEIEPQRRVTHAFEHFRLDLGVRFVLRTDETV